MTELCISDFGLYSKANVYTTGETSKGSLPYLAPELLTFGASYDSAIDIWALGVILYELLTCEQPFAESDDNQ